MRRRRTVVGAPLVGTPACATDLFGARQQHPGAGSGRGDKSRQHARGVSGPGGSAKLQQQAQPQPQQPQPRHVHFAASTPVAPVARSRRGETMVRAARSLLVRQGGGPAPGAASGRQRAPQAQAEHRTALDTHKELSPLRQEIKVCQSAASWWPSSALTLRESTPTPSPPVLGAFLPREARAQSHPGGHRGRQLGARFHTCVYPRSMLLSECQPHARTHSLTPTSFPSSCDAVDKYREYARLRGVGDDAASQGSPRSVGALVSTSSWQTGTQTTDSAVAHTAATNGGAAAAWQGAREGARGLKRTGAGDAQQQPTRSSRRRR
jgi:hypothetical protein